MSKYIGIALYRKRVSRGPDEWAVHVVDPADYNVYDSAEATQEVEDWALDNITGREYQSLKILTEMVDE